MHVILNPSPFNDAVTRCNLSMVSLFLMNADEGQQLSGEAEPNLILDLMSMKYPNSAFVLTLGSDGCLYRQGSLTVKQEAFHVKATDTTAAGDTFTGYFLAALASKAPIELCLRQAALAASIAVTRPGAAPSIPYSSELSSFLD